MFKFKRDKDWDKPFSRKIAKRVSKIATADLPLWADQAIYETSRLLTAYERERTPQAMAELTDGAEAVHALVWELSRRSRKLF